jgi:DNA-binding transcriptional LysR family regulator
LAASRFLAQRLPTLLADHPGLEVELVVGDRLGDMIEDRLDLAMRLGEISECVTGGAPERYRLRCCGSAKLHRASRRTIYWRRAR